MQEQPRRRGGFLQFLVSLIIIGLAVALFLQRQYVIDRFTVWQFQPSSSVSALAEKSQMNDEGKFYFYASRPEINDKASFNNNCTSASEQTVVLGCYAAQRIYVFDVTDERLAGIKEVTAAHEMLHAVYDRLGRAEKDRVNGLLEQQLSSVTDKRIINLIAVYDKTEPGQRLNEIHSIFATEIENLSPELEAYYKKYFTDRAQVVALSKQYESVFSSIKERQAVLISELDALSDEILAQTEQYNAGAQQLSADIAAFNQRASNNGYSSQAQFNADRQSLVQKQTQLAALRDTINAASSLYNQKRDELQELNGQAQNLNQSINSNSLEEAPSL